jgi:hypothetical protein
VLQSRTHSSICLDAALAIFLPVKKAKKELVMHVPAFPIQDCMQTKKNSIFGRIPHPLFPLLLAQEFVTKETQVQVQTAVEEEKSLLTSVKKTYAATRTNAP